MAQLLSHVERGEVIYADKWNLLVDAVNELLQAGQTTGIKVAAIVPAGTIAEPIRIGTLLQITGQNFGYSIGQSSVTFEGLLGSVVVPHEKMLTGSSDSRLLLITPPIPGLPEVGATMTLRVDNGVAHDARSVFVMPIVVILQGDVFVNWRADITPNPKPNPLLPAQPAEFAFQLQTGINIPAGFDLGADILNATAAIPPELVQSIEFRDEGGQLISSKRVEMGKSETRNIIVRIPVIPPLWGNQSFSLKVSATSGSVKNAETRSFTVGKTVPPSDENIDMKQTGWIAINPTTGEVDPNHNNGVLEETNVKLKAGWQLIVMFNVQFKQKGTYDITIQPKEGTPLNGWSLQLVNTPSSIAVATDNESSLVQFGITASVGATANGIAMFRIKRQGATSDQSKEYSIQLWQ